jgi:hypothetical protein
VSNNELVYAAFFYVPDVTVGHGWTENYKTIIDIFCRSATKVGLIPVHIHPRNVKPITETHYQCEDVDTSQLMFYRELAYLDFINYCSAPAILSDPDQVFVQKPPPLYNNLARVVYRPNDYAAFNGPRMYMPKFTVLQKRTVDRMSMMLPRYKAWDGDSIAFADAVREYWFTNSYDKHIDFVHPDSYISRPIFLEKQLNENLYDVYMMHFKGNSAKNEMIEFAKKAAI